MSGHADSPEAAAVRRAGEFLYGDHFRAPLAVALDVSKGTVKNWATGRSRVSPAVFDELARLVEARASELASVGAAIRALLEKGLK